MSALPRLLTLLLLVTSGRSTSGLTDQSFISNHNRGHGDTARTHYWNKQKPSTNRLVGGNRDRIFHQDELQSIFLPGRRISDKLQSIFSVPYRSALPASLSYLMKRANRRPVDKQQSSNQVPQRPRPLVRHRRQSAEGPELSETGFFQMPSNFPSIAALGGFEDLSMGHSFQQQQQHQQRDGSHLSSEEFPGHSARLSDESLAALYEQATSPASRTSSSSNLPHHKLQRPRRSADGRKQQQQFVPSTWHLGRRHNPQRALNSRGTKRRGQAGFYLSYTGEPEDTQPVSLLYQHHQHQQQQQQQQYNPLPLSPQPYPQRQLDHSALRQPDPLNQHHLVDSGDYQQYSSGRHDSSGSVQSEYQQEHQPDYFSSAQDPYEDLLYSPSLSTDSYIVLRGGMFPDAIDTVSGPSALSSSAYLYADDPYNHDFYQSPGLDHFRDFAEFAHGSEQVIQLARPDLLEGTEVAGAASRKEQAVLQPSNIQQLLSERDLGQRKTISRRSGDSGSRLVYNDDPMMATN